MREVRYRVRSRATTTRGKEGLLAAAEGGTVYLDEIAELSLTFRLSCYARCRIVRSPRWVGTHAVPISARILAASNRDLAAMVE